MGTEGAISSGTSGQGAGSGGRWPPWYSELTRYRRSSAWTALGQLANTLLPYSVLWVVMALSIRRGYPCAITWALMPVAALFFVRLFVLFHDCVHGSLFPRQGLNTFFGHALGLLTFTPFDDWRFSHLRHHATYANLDARGFGDIWTMTRAEYEAAAPATRRFYRFYRNPIVLFGLGAIFIFLLRYRLPTRKAKRKELMSVVFTNLLLAALILLAVRTIGWRAYLLVQLPIMWLAGAAGVWLFYVQHQFAGVYWSRRREWDGVRAALEGSSCYALPPILRWFSANIGYHHVHHLNSRIPNYRLKPCLEAIPALSQKPALTIRESLAGTRFKLWDEERQRLVGFG